MTEYRRARTPGGCWFFTVALAERHNNHLLVEHIDTLRKAFRYVKERHPFHIDAIVILPEHLHCIWTLPKGDTNFSTRWSLVKTAFSRALPSLERRTLSRVKRGERGVWQRRFWEHLVRDEEDCRRHVDYIHWNPVKHGWVDTVVDWPYSSFGQFVERGVYPVNWGGGAVSQIVVGEFGE